MSGEGSAPPCMSSEERPLTQGQVSSVLERVAPASRVDGAESEGGQAVLRQHLEYPPVARVKSALGRRPELGVVLGPHRVDHKSGRQIVALAQLRFACATCCAGQKRSVPISWVKNAESLVCGCKNLTFCRREKLHTLSTRVTARWAKMAACRRQSLKWSVSSGRDEHCISFTCLDTIRGYRKRWPIVLEDSACGVPTFLLLRHALHCLQHRAPAYIPNVSTLALRRKRRNDWMDTN